MSNSKHTRQDALSSKAIRKECLEILDELKKWKINPVSYSQKKKFINIIKFTYNTKKLNNIHSRLQQMLDKAMIEKLSSGLENVEEDT